MHPSKFKDRKKNPPQFNVSIPNNNNQEIPQNPRIWSAIPRKRNHLEGTKSASDYFITRSDKIQLAMAIVRTLSQSIAQTSLPNPDGNCVFLLTSDTEIDSEIPIQYVVIHNNIVLQNSEHKLTKQKEEKKMPRSIYIFHALPIGMASAIRSFSDMP